MNWFRLVTVCLGAWLIGYLFDQPGLDGMWFVFKSAISMVMICLCLIIYTKLALVIAVLETLFLFVTYIATWEYSLGPEGIFYEYYVEIMYCVALAELIALIAGAPIDRSTIRAVLARHTHSRTSDRRGTADSKPHRRKNYRLPHSQVLEEI